MGSLGPSTNHYPRRGAAAEPGLLEVRTLFVKHEFERENVQPITSSPELYVTWLP